MLTHRDLAAIAHLTYSSDPTWAKEDVHACLTEKDGYSVVAFRGTTLNPEDWLRDLDGWPAYQKGIGFCHAGFLNGVLLVKDQILKDLEGKTVILTGHSLGGALALILGAFLAQARRMPHQLVTFGAPRAGSHKLARALKKVPELVQYRNGNDPVPEVPWLPGFYVHAKQLTHIGRDAIDPLENHHIELYRDLMPR